MYLLGVRFFQISKALPEPDLMPKLKAVKNGVAQVSQPPKKFRLLITLSIPRKISYRPHRRVTQT